MRQYKFTDEFGRYLKLIKQTTGRLGFFWGGGINDLHGDIFLSREQVKKLINHLNIYLKERKR